MISKRLQACALALVTSTLVAAEQLLPECSKRSPSTARAWRATSSGDSADRTVFVYHTPASYASRVAAALSRGVHAARVFDQRGSSRSSGSMRSASRSIGRSPAGRGARADRRVSGCADACTTAAMYSSPSVDDGRLGELRRATTWSAYVDSTLPDDRNARVARAWRATGWAADGTLAHRHEVRPDRFSEPATR